MPGFKLFLDAGHGWEPGALGPGGIKEKDYTLRLVLSLIDKLTITCPSWEVEVTFLTDPTAKIWPGERARMANKAKADFFLSVHLNSNKGTPGTGSEVWSTEKRLPDADILVSVIATALGLPDRGGKATRSNGDVVNSDGVIIDRGQFRLPVIHKTTMPAFLIEAAFINNPADILALEANWDSLVAAIVSWLITMAV